MPQPTPGRRSSSRTRTWIFTNTGHLRLTFIVMCLDCQNAPLKWLIGCFHCIHLHIYTTKVLHPRPDTFLKAVHSHLSQECTSAALLYKSMFNCQSRDWTYYFKKDKYQGTPVMSTKPVQLKDVILTSQNRGNMCSSCRKRLWEWGWEAKVDFRHCFRDWAQSRTRRWVSALALGHVAFIQCS